MVENKSIELSLRTLTNLIDLAELKCQMGDKGDESHAFATEQQRPPFRINH